MRSHARRRFLVGLLCGAATLSAARAAETTVAVAANFAAPMQEIAASFARDTSHRAILVPGATGTLAAQIRHGAPFDALLAADRSTPLALAEEGLADAATRFTYATGRLALWSAQPGFVDNAGQVLRRARFQHLAAANPRAAPYGRAALETLRALGLEEALRPRLVLGESVAQAYQFVASGNAPLGFVALSQIQSQGRLRSGSVWVVPSTLHAPLHQDAIVLTRGARNPATLALMRYLRSAAATRILRAHGYE